MIEIANEYHAPKSTVAIKCSLVYVQDLLPGSVLWLHLFIVCCNARPHSKIRGARLPPPPSTPPCRLSQQLPTEPLCAIITTRNSSLNRITGYL